MRTDADEGQKTETNFRIESYFTILYKMKEIKGKSDNFQCIILTSIKNLK